MTLMRRITTYMLIVISLMLCLSDYIDIENQNAAFSGIAMLSLLFTAAIESVINYLGVSNG